MRGVRSFEDRSVSVAGLREKAAGGRHLSSIKRLSLLLLLLCLPAAGCDTDRVSQFSTFAAAGSEYVRLFHRFSGEVGAAMIASDSATMIAARNIAGSNVSTQSAVFIRQLQREDRLLQQYLGTLEQIDRHAELLGAYFDAVAKLTDKKVAQGAESSANALLDSMNKLNPEIEAATVGGRSVKSFLQPAAALTVAHFQARRLNENLGRAAPVIDRALTLQEAAVNAMSEQLKQSLQASLEGKESTDVIGPYVTNGPLPPGWAERRASYLRASVALKNAEHAKVAIAALHSAFRSLVADRDGQVDLQSLLLSVEKMRDYVSTAEGTAQGTAQGTSAGHP